MGGSDPHDDNDRDPPRKDFICGAVEGFYGRPWTLAQRKDMFEKKNEWGMNSYLYAPKDDCKHRAFWRELYTVEEAEHLESLITAASENNVHFYYALSPGLDIQYSNSKEISTLKRKLDQVAQLGCKAFALLFDDIEAEMSKPDKEAFQSFAHAQVSITNEIYQHLGQARFLFCPTQYCTARAVPTIATSEYLKTIGSKLAPDINIMWTGDKVISKDITVKSLEDITEVLKRKPVIWDNEHANDYDQKRLFLGPYSGRSPDIISKLNGVLTNPNCEYGANFVALHTLASWSHCSVDGCSSGSVSEAVSADIKLEMGSSEAGEVPPPPSRLPSHVYHPRHALKSALGDWLPEFNKTKMMWGPMSKPQVALTPTGIIQPLINTGTTTTKTVSCGVPTITTTTGATVASQPMLSIGAILAQDGSVGLNPEPEPALQTLISVPVMNSLVSDHLVDIQGHGLIPVSSDPVVEPMETAPISGDGPATPSSSPADLCLGDNGVNASPPSPLCNGAKTVDVNMETQPPTPASVMQVEPSDGSNGLSKAESTTMLCDPGPTSPCTDSNVDLQELSLTTNDLELLCDLFYLPCEHGPKGLEILNEFYWLKTNSIVMLTGQDKPEVPSEVTAEDWTKRREAFTVLIGDIRRLFDKICMAQNRELVYNLYTYLWDIVGVTLVLQGYIDWLALGHFNANIQQLVIGRHTWFSGIREAFQSGDHEAWVFRGGLTADLQRLMPVDSGNDLFIYQYPDLPTNVIYTVRSYTPEDEEACYRIALGTWDDGLDANETYASHPRLVGDKSIGHFLAFSPNHAFVCTNNLGEVIGFVVASVNAKEFYRRTSIAWLPELRAKYPKVEKAEGELLTPCEATINSLHTEEPCMPPGLADEDGWAVCKVVILPTIPDTSIAKRATLLLLGCLRSSGVLRVFAEISNAEKYAQQAYLGIGFTPLTEADDSDKKPTYSYMFRRY